MNTEQFWKPKTVEDLAVYWLSCHARARKATSSISRDAGMLRNHLLPAFGGCEINALDPARFDFWLSNLRKSGKLSPKSCNDLLGLTRKIFNDGIYWGFVNSNPLAKIRKFDLPEQDFDFWNHTEVEQFLGYWRKRDPRPVSFWGILIALHTGLRRGEIIGLKWDTIDFEKRMINVKRAYCRVGKETREQTKSKKIRRIPMSTSLAAELSELRPITCDSGYVTPRCYPVFETVSKIGEGSWRASNSFSRFEAHFCI